MKQIFFIFGSMPGMNDIARKHYRIYTRLKNEAVDRSFAYIRKAKIKPMEWAHISFEWRERDQARDPDNVMAAQKFILDALVHAKILRDDGWAQIASLRHTFMQSPEPGVLVTLSDERS